MGCQRISEARAAPIGHLRVRWSRPVHKESVMSDNNNERRELTAAELDLVAGGYTLEIV